MQTSAFTAVLRPPGEINCFYYSTSAMLEKRKGGGEYFFCLGMYVHVIGYSLF